KMSLNWVEDEWQLDLTFITGEVSYLICPIRMFRAPLKPITKIGLSLGYILIFILIILNQLTILSLIGEKVTFVNYTQ
ncbi:hypothetical protein OFN22_30915, partial [Escherichia coli]|nr:hypothetical protein [Escherichia coli]